MTEFFQLKQMPVCCGFTSRDKVTIKIVMQKEKYEKILKDLNKPTSRVIPIADKSLSEGPETKDLQVKKTFIIHVPADEQQTVLSVRISSSSVPKLNQIMNSCPNNMYSLEVVLPAHNAPAGRYYYEIKLRKYLGFGISYKHKWTSNHFTIGNTVVRRDLLYEEDNCLIGQLKDVIVGSTGKFSHIDLISQSNYLCKKVLRKAAEYCIRAISTVELRNEDSVTRFATILGWLTTRFGIKINDFPSADLADRVIIALKSRNLSEFPGENQTYLPELCQDLCKRSSICGNSILEFMHLFWAFLGEALILDLLRASFGKREGIMNASCVEDVYDIIVKRCMCLIKKHKETGENVFKELLEMLIRHCPTNYVVSLICDIKKAQMHDKLCVDEDVLNAITTCTRANMLSGIKKAKRDRQLIDLLKLATQEVQLGLKDEKVQESLRENICDLFYSNTKVSSDILLEATLGCLHHSRCFEDSDSCRMLIQAIVQSNSSVVRNLFLPLLKEHKLMDAFVSLEVSSYKEWLQSELKDNLRHRDENEIAFNLCKFIHIINVPLVKERQDVCNALEEVLVEWLQRYTLYDLIQSIPVIHTLCDSEPAILCLFENQVRQLLRKGGRKPHEVLLQFCLKGKLSVNNCTTSELVSSTIDIFFKEESEKACLEIFEAMLKHVEFWQIVSGASGDMVGKVHMNPTYVCIKNAITEFANLLILDELNVCYLPVVCTNSNNANALLKIGGLQAEEIGKCLKKFKKEVEESNERISLALYTIQAVQKRSIPNVPDLTDIVSSIKVIRKRMESGNISLKECMSVKWQWGDMECVPSICQSLHGLIESEVFWNISDKAILKAYSDNLSHRSELHTLLYVRFMYLEDSCEQDVDKLAAIHDAVDFLSVVKNIGIKLYSDIWETLENNPEIKMIDVSKMFRNAKVPEELTIAERYFDRPVVRKTKTTLTQIWETKDVIDKANAMESVIEVLGYNIEDYLPLKRDIMSFKELISEKVEEYTMCDIHKALTNIFGLTKSLSDVTVKVMEEMGKSKQLIEFLQDIAIGDIRNLIDAVEDISVSHVQESTVSALIEIKRFLEPLVNPPFEDINSKWIFQTLEKQTTSRKDHAIGIPAKISDCTDNLHNLKSLYNNVANRGQQTKEIIKSVVTKGEFMFILDPDKEVVTYAVQYKDNKNKYDKHETTLQDIRSRALLLLNTERQSAESSFNAGEFRAFIHSIDLCMDIRDTVLQLYTSGHIQYTDFKKKFSIKSLQEIKESLKDDLDKWTIKMKGIRETYYLMNFIGGLQIHTLNKFLQNSCPDVGVAAVLKFVHPELSMTSVLDAYKRQFSSDDEQVEEMGRSIHSASDELGIFHRNMECSDCTKKIGDSVQEGHIFVSQLDESSNYAIKTILALYHNTTHRLPEPNQLLFCSPDTKWCEIELLLQRCKGAMEFYGSMPLYCLANVEKLQNVVQFKLVDELQKLKPGSKYLLAVVCRGNKNHPFVDRLSENVGVIQPMSDVSLEKLLEDKFPDVQTYTSEVAGLGKTSEINKDAAKKDLSTLTLHISGNFRRNALVEYLMKLNIHSYHVLLLDVGSVDDLDELDVFLFELIVLKFVSAGKGAFYLSTANVSLEIANSINNILRNTLLAATSFKRVHLKWKEFDDFLPSMEINSPVQVVCKYLDAIDHGQLDQKDIKFSGTLKAKALSVIECRQLLRKHMGTTSDISFSIVHIFLNVLAEQLKKLSCSSFFKVSRISDMIGQNVVPTVRSNLVKSMIEVSREFASRSVNACRSEQGTTLSYKAAVELSAKDLADLAVNRVDSMIRWEESNHLIYVFHNQNIQTLSAMYRDDTKVPEHVRKMFETQMSRTLQNYSQMKQLELQQILQRVARLQRIPLSDKQLADLSSDYALTPDNLLKMILIMMRIQSRVPVVIMGETGCGKTSLIRYLANICDVPFRVLNIHAGTSSKDVADTIMESNSDSIKLPGKQNWLFLDEINTSENIGMICDTICHRKCNGEDLMPNLIIMGACNPYKLRTKEAIKTAGLTGKVKTDDLSKLVYRVLPLPEMMVDYIWDFGSLNKEDEALYIERMIEGVLGKDMQMLRLLRDLLSASQKFVREQEASTCVVSLRDVHRCKTLACWFDRILKLKKTKTEIDVSLRIKAMILALAHCYHCRFMDKTVRFKYRRVLSQEMLKNELNISEDCIYNIIKEEQKDILERMDLPPGTAKNSALQENIFVILVCILNKIPIFVVGKPGCSKSLAMQVIRSNLRGKDSKDTFFKTLPQLYCVSFQGSESSTSDGIRKVFEKAEYYQKSNTKDDVLSVVILDEIGLAEVSRFNPLKVLHSLLEPEGRSRPNVAVVGISNWALDASKMNRAIHLSRPDMDEDELFETAVSISKSFTDSVEIEQRGLSLNPTHVQFSINKIDEELRLIAQSYILYTKQLQFKHFHGLRDFYSLVKFVSRRIAQEKKQYVTAEIKTDIIMEGLQRNFGGLRLGQSNIMEHFQRCLKTSEYATTSIDELIGMNINDTLARHLMVITKGESVLDIIKQHLCQLKRDRTETIFGSQFEEDLTDDYNYRILSKIILCMEQGIVLILKDLENIYGSLYDMLNQNYTRIGKKNNCRVALGPYSNPFCHVAESFRCIVLVDENKLDYSDPPFLNRFEKQYLTFSDVLNPEQHALVSEMQSWVKRLTFIDETPFSELNAFPFFNEELLVSLVLCKEKYEHTDSQLVLNCCKQELLWLLRPEVILRLDKVSDPELHGSRFELRDEYFALPIHEGLGYFINYHKDNFEQLMPYKTTVIFTNSNIHAKISGEMSEWNYQSEKIGAFKSEKQLSITLKQFWDTADSEILLVHCNAEEDGKHLMLTKSVIEKYVAQYNNTTDSRNKLVYIIVHLNGRDLYQNVPSSLYENSLGSISQINFLSGCKLVMLDSLERPRRPLPSLCNTTLFEMIEFLLKKSSSLKNEIFWAFTRIKFGEQSRDVDSINVILNKIKESDVFLNHLADLVCKHLESVLPPGEDEGWCVAVACDIQALNTCSNFVNALEEHVKCIVKKPLAKLIYKMECMGILDCFFIDDDQKDGRRSLWLALVSDERYFCIDNEPDPSGPECFFCDIPDIALKVPFSRVVFNAVEKTKDTFMDGVMRAKVKCEIEADDELPAEIMDEIKLQHEAFITSAVSEYMMEHSLDTYSSLREDYTYDFCNLFSNNVVSHLNRESRICCAKWLFLQKSVMKGEPLLIIISNLHCLGWIHYSTITPALQLLELCSDVFDQPMFHSLSVFHFSSSDEGLDMGQISATHVTDEFEADNDLENNSDIADEYESSVLMENSYSVHGHKSDDSSSETVACEPDNTSENNLNVDEFESNVLLDKSNTLHEPNSAICSSEAVICEPDNTLESNSAQTIEGAGHENISPEYQSSPSIKEKASTCDDTSFISAMSSKNEDNEEEDEISNEKGSHYFENVADIVSSVDDLEQFVSIVSREMLMKFAKGASGKWLLATRNFITLATEVSDVLNLHKLRLCNDVITYFLEPHGLKINELEPLGVILQDNDIDSEDVFNELIQLFETISNECSAMTKSRTISQYLFRCIASNEETTAYRFLFQVVVDSIVPENEYGLFKESLSTFLQDIKDDIYDVLVSNTYDDQSVDMDDESVLSQLNVCLQHLYSEERQDGPFTLMIVDLLQYLIDVPDEDDDFVDLMMKAGIVLQKESSSLLFVTAVAFLKSSIVEVIDRSAQNKSGCSSLWTTLNAVIVGLENVPIHCTVQVFFLKTLGQASCIHSILRYCNDISSFPCMAEVNWSKQLWSKFLEYNPLAIYVPVQILKNAEQLMLSKESFAENMNMLKNIVQQDICNGRLLVFSLAMSAYYTPRYREMLDDTIRHQAGEFLEVALGSADSTNDEQILQFLTGKKDLPNGLFELNEQTSFQQYMINTSLVSLYCLMLSKWNDKSMNGKPLLFKCLFTPSEIQTLYLPGVATMHTEQCLAKQVMPHKKAPFALCTCGYRIFLNGNGPFQCAVCKKEVQVEEHALMHDTAHADTIRTGYFYKDTDSSNGYTNLLGNMTALSFHLLHFLMKSALLGSVVFDTSNSQIIEEVLSVSEIDLFEFLEHQIIDHWKHIGNLSNLDDYGIGQFLHMVFKSSDSVLFKNRCSFDSLSATEEWEKLFNSHVSHLVSNCFSTLHKHNQLCNEVYGSLDVTLEAQIREADALEKRSTSDRLQLLPSIFRLAKDPSRSNFMCWLSISREGYPLLVKVLQCEEDLRLPIHLYNIIQWHLITCIKISYSMKRWQCSDMSVREFLDKQSGKGLVKTMFKAFRTSITSLKKRLDVKEFIDIPSLSENSKLHDCLMLDKECWLFKVLSKLVQIQNEFIDFCLMLSFECKNLQFLIRDDNSSCVRYVRVAELKTENLINMKMDDETFDDLLRENSCPELAYGCGHVIRYDFHNIEKDLVYDLLIDGRRAYIQQSGLQFIVFKDELYRMFVSLLKDVCQSVQQKPLPADLATQIKKTTAETPSMANEMINNLDMILTLLKRSKCDPETPLTEYIQTFSNMIGQDFPKKYLPSPEGSLKVCHVVSFHVLLEEISADQVIGSLEEKYEAELGDDVQEHFSSMASKSVFKAETVAGALKRFIYRCIYMCQTTPEQPLVQFMNEPSFWKESTLFDGKLKLEGNTDEMSDVFPSEVKVCHAVQIVHLLNESIETHRQEDLRMDHVITAWKSKQTPSKPKQTTKKSGKLKRR